MPVLGYVVQIKFGPTWENYPVITDGFIRSEVLHKDLKPADSTLTFSMVPDVTLYNQLRGIGVSEIPISVTKDGSPFFYGYIRKTFNITKTQKLQPVKIECVSPSFLLKRKIGYNLSYKNITVTNLLTNLLVTAGITSYTLPTINYPIPGFTVIANEGGTYHSYIEKILFEYGYVFYFDKSGAFVTYPLFPDDITTTNYLDGTNCLNKIEQIKSEESKEKVIVNWTGVKTLTDKIVFSDTTGAQGGYKCLIEIPPQGYLGDKEEWYAEFDVEEGEILSTTTISLDIIKDADIEVLTFTQVGNRALVSVKNNNLSVPMFIRKFDIKASSIVVKKETNKSIVIKNPVTEKVETVDTEYVFDIDSANDLANGLAWWYRYSDFDYKATSKTEYQLGDIVTVSDTGIGTNTTRVISKKTDTQTNIFDYGLEAIDEFVPDVPEVEYTTTTVPAIETAQFNAYYLDTNTTIVKIFEDDSFVPDEVVFDLKTKLGMTTTAYNGIFRIYIDSILTYTSPTPVSQLVIDSTNYLDFGFTYPLKDVQVMTVQFWDSTNTVLLDEKPVSFLKDIAIDIDEIAEEVETKKPVYLGMFLDDFPTVFKVGDWFLLFGEDDIPNQRGMYRVKADLEFERIEGSSTDDNQYVLNMMPDILSITSSGDYGAVEDYGTISFFANLATNTVFADAVRVGTDNLDSTMIEGGKIKANIIDVDTILGENATFSGTINSVAGIFKGSIESGPLILNVAQPGTTQTFTTTSKTAYAFIVEVNTAGIALGKYSCTGTYNSLTAASAELILSSTGTRTYYGSYNTSHNIAYGTCQVLGKTYTNTRRYNDVWYGYVNKRTATLKIYDAADTLICNVSGLFWDASTDYTLQSSTATSTYQCIGWVSPATPPSTAMPAGDATSTLATGSISFNSGTFTYKLSNLPAYSSSLPTGTVYLSASGSNYILMVKGA